MIHLFFDVFYKVCIIIIIISIFVIKCLNIDCNGRAVTRSFLEREVSSSNLEAVKSEIVLPTACHRCNISSEEAVLPADVMTRR